MESVNPQREMYEGRMQELADQVARTADKVVKMCAQRNGHHLDFSEASLSVIEEMLEEASSFFEEFTSEQKAAISQDFGCYILEVARREFGGMYEWLEEREQPILVVGEPRFRIGLITWDKVQGRLSGDSADNVPYFYAGFADRARQPEPGQDILFV